MGKSSGGKAQEGESGTRWSEWSEISSREYSTYLSKADRVRRDKLRRKREEEEQQQTGKDDSSRIVEVTDEEAEKITQENAQTKVMVSTERFR